MHKPFHRPICVSVSGWLTACADSAILAPNQKDLRGRVQIPTGGNDGGARTIWRFRTSPRAARQDTGAIPGPTVQSGWEKIREHAAHRWMRWPSVGAPPRRLATGGLALRAAL
ncbi:MAG: hypothetical protein OHK0022_01760 [Roseiflexaceae bacterium]